MLSWGFSTIWVDSILSPPSQSFACVYPEMSFSDEEREERLRRRRRLRGERRDNSGMKFLIKVAWWLPLHGPSGWYWITLFGRGRSDAGGPDVTGVYLGCSGYQQNRKPETEPQGKLFSCHLYTWPSPAMSTFGRVISSVKAKAPSAAPLGNPVGGTYQ